MGQMTDTKIEAWQKAAGIEPATGERLKGYEAAQKLAFDLIKVIELEKSGIRDGNGYWHGSDPLGSIAHELNMLVIGCPNSDVLNSSDWGDIVPF